MDLPAHELLQQLNARPITGEHLEVLGKKASADWNHGRFNTMNEAVVATVKHAGLSPEQVRRVVEFANTDAFLTNFKKEGAEHRVVDFRGGPASPADVLQDLNDGGGGTVFDKGAEDYRQPPVEKTASIVVKHSMDKTASVEEPGPTVEDEALYDLFKTSGPTEYPEENPLGDLIDLKDKLASVKETYNSQLSDLEIMYADLAGQVYDQVKQAALSGRPMSDLLQAWQTVAPSTEHVKIAFQLFTPRLLREGVFSSPRALNDSITKTSAARIVNERHPIVQSFGEFCQTLDKLAEVRAICEEVQRNFDEVTQLVKQASTLGDTVGKIQELSERGGNAVGNALEPHLGGAVGSVVRGAGKVLPTAAALVAANEVRRRAKYSRTVNKVNAMANPLSDAYYQHEVELANRAGVYPQ